MPAVDFVAMAPRPARSAVMMPACRSYAVAVSTPVVPVMVPPVSLTVPTVSENVESRSSPPLTVTGAVLTRWLLAA